MAAPTTATEYRAHIDSGRTHLPLCACGWRGIPTPSLVTAWAQAKVHEQAQHPGQRQALRAHADAVRRAAGRG